MTQTLSATDRAAPRAGENPFEIGAASGASRHTEGQGGVARTFVFFEIAGQDFAVDVAYVREILDRQVVTPVPRADPGMEGVIDLRGRSIAVIDLAATLGLPRCTEAADTRYLVLERDVEGSRAEPRAVCTDRVREVAQIADSEIELPPRKAIPDRGSAVRGLIRRSDRVVMLLDLQDLFGDTPDAGSSPADAGANLFEFAE